MTGIFSLIVGLIFGISLIYVIFPIFAQKKEKKESYPNREREAREENIQREIERLNEDWLAGKILKEDYDGLIKKLKEG